MPLAVSGRGIQMIISAVLYLRHNGALDKIVKAERDT